MATDKGDTDREELRIEINALMRVRSKLDDELNEYKKEYSEKKKEINREISQLRYKLDVATRNEMMEYAASGMTRKEIGELYGMPPQRVGQILSLDGDGDIYSLRMFTKRVATALIKGGVGTLNELKLLLESEDGLPYIQRIGTEGEKEIERKVGYPIEFTQNSNNNWCWKKIRKMEMKQE